MTVPNEGTTNLPTDAAAHVFEANWDGSNFYANRGDVTYGRDVDVTRMPADQFGEVQASPTQYTLLGRLKDLLTPVLAAGANVIGSVMNAGPAWTSLWGVADVPITSADMTTAVNVTDAPTSGQKVVVDQIIVSAHVATVFGFREETSATTVAFVRCPAGDTKSVAFTDKRKLETANKRLTCTTDVAGAVEVLVGWHSEA